MQEAEKMEMNGKVMSRSGRKGSYGMTWLSKSVKNLNFL